jgi:PAS domain S-box-containing protein
MIRSEAVNILLVDDQPRNLDALEAMLSGSGYRFVRAKSADEALLALLADEFAAMVLDIRMPGMDGFDLARVIKQRKRTQHIPILFLTAHLLEQEDILRAYGVGGVDYLSKPINPEVLRSKIAVFVDLFRKTRALASVNAELESEILEREKAQAALREMNTDLETRVRERTTELMRANQDVRKSEDRLRMAMAVAEMAAWDWNLSTGEILWSTDPETLFGLPSGTLRPQASLFLVMHQDDKPATEAARERAAETGEYEVDYRVVRPDGRVIWIADRGRVVRGSEGRPERILGISMNLTRRKEAEDALRESEERFRTLADNMPGILARYDRDLQHVFVNLEARTALGLSAEALLGRTLQDTDIAPEACKAWEESIRAVFETGRSQAVELDLMTVDGRRTYLARVVPEYGGGGQVRTVLWLAHDVTEQRRQTQERERVLEQERKARTEMERQNRLKDEFLATVSHELRTPLNAIIGWANILSRRSADSEGYRDAITVISRNARAQARLIDDLLDMSRITSGEVRLEVQPVRLTGIVTAVIASIQQNAEAKRIEIRNSIDDHALVYGDPNRLQQVVYNLVENAVKFTPSEGRVEVSVERNHTELHLSVRDTGEGIAPDFLPHVFDKFRQADSSTTRRHGGLGLGLSIVKHIVDLHGGTVRAESEGVGRGAAFIVSLPVVAELAQDLRQGTAQADLPREQGSHG